MKSMKSVKLFLFSVGAILTVLFAIAVSKPYNTVSVDSNFVSNESNSVKTIFADDSATVYDSTDLAEGESTAIEEDTTASVTEGQSDELSVTAVQKETATNQATTSTERKSETTTSRLTTTEKRETATQKQPTTHKETTAKPSSPPVTTTSNDPEQMTVYYTKTGKRYHYANPCGQGTYYPTTLADAKSRGLTPCQKCVLH